MFILVLNLVKNKTRKDNFYTLFDLIHKSFYSRWPGPMSDLRQHSIILIRRKPSANPRPLHLTTQFLYHFLYSFCLLVFFIFILLSFYLVQACPNSPKLVTCPNLLLNCLILQQCCDSENDSGNTRVKNTVAIV